jgi:hypothetical protein
MNRVSVLRRDTGALSHRFGKGFVDHPVGLCFTHNYRRIAVASRSGVFAITVFDAGGEFLHDAPLRQNGWRQGSVDVGCLASGELVFLNDNKLTVFYAEGTHVLAEASQGSPFFRNGFCTDGTAVYRLDREMDSVIVCA